MMVERSQHMQCDQHDEERLAQFVDFFRSVDAAVPGQKSGDRCQQHEQIEQTVDSPGGQFLGS